MKQNNLPDKWQDRFLDMPDLNQVESIFKRVFADVDSLWAQMMGKISSQVKLQETNDFYEISVFDDRIEHPNDIEARLENGYLHLHRTVQLEAKRECRRRRRLAILL